MLLQFLGGSPVLVGAKTWTVAVALEDGDLIIEFAAPQGILDEMQVWPNPEADGIKPSMFGRFSRRNRPTKGDESVAERLVPAKGARPHDGAQPVGANQRIALIGCSISASDPRAIAQVLNHDGMPVSFQRDQRVFLAGAQQGDKKIVAVQHHIGIVKGVEERPAQVRRSQRFAAEGVYQKDAFGKDCALADLAQNAEPIERMRRIRSKLNPRANLGKRGSLFEQVNTHAYAGERQGCRHAANATTHDDERDGTPLGHSISPPTDCGWLTPNTALRACYSYNSGCVSRFI